MWLLTLLQCLGPDTMYCTNINEKDSLLKYKIKGNKLIKTHVNGGLQENKEMILMGGNPKQDKVYRISSSNTELLPFKE